jgi:hypothetical protein
LPAILRLSVRQAQLPDGASELHALPEEIVAKLRTSWRSMVVVQQVPEKDHSALGKTLMSRHLWFAPGERPKKWSNFRVCLLTARKKFERHEFPSPACGQANTTSALQELSSYA